MTTIAQKDGVMAADSRSTCGDVIFDDNVKKLIRVKDGWVGCAGVNSDIEKLVEHLTTPKDEATLVKLEVVGILMQDDGKDYLLSTSEGCYYKTLITSGCWAIGSGAPYALSQMRSGASAVTSVQVAIECDIYSGGKVQSIKRGQKK